MEHHEANESRPTPILGRTLSEEKVHAGYEFESGMFSRFRSWVDVAPWIRLVRVLRILASPSHVGLVALAISLTYLLFSLIDYPSRRMGVFSNSGAAPMTDPQEFVAFMQRSPLYVWASLALESRGLSIRGPWDVAALTALVFLWLPVIQANIRAGAVLTTGQPLPTRTFRLSISRYWKSCIVVVLPWICAVMLGLLLLALRVPSLLLEMPFVSVGTGWLLGILALPIGVLAFGAIFAIPLGCAAIVNEPDPDPIDSLSRGYEYLMRRPLSLFWYLFLAFWLVGILGLALSGVTEASRESLDLIGGKDKTLINAGRSALQVCLTAWKVTLASGLLGGIYLLLRHDAGGQEVEDLWTPPKQPTPSLAKLPEKAFDS